MSTTTNLRSLIGKLNSATRESLEAPAGLCLSRTQYDIEIEHWVAKLRDSTRTEFDIVLREYRIQRTRLSADLTRRIDSFKIGNARTPAFSPDLFKLLTETWLATSLNFGDDEIRTGHVLFALLANDHCKRLITETTQELDPILPVDLSKRLADINKRSTEASRTSRKSDVQTTKPRSEEFVFVSYDRADQEFVFWLAEELRKNQVDLWIDQWAIIPGDDWDKEIEAAIERCRQFLIVLTPDACQFREVSSEFRAALHRHKQIIPILLKPCSLPRHLLTIQHVNFTGTDYRQEIPLNQVVRRLAVKN